MNGQCSCGYRPGRISSIDCRCVTHRELNERLRKIDPNEGYYQKEIDELKASKQDKLIAGQNITIEGSLISADLDSTNFYNKTETDELLAGKQDTLTAGENITISEDNVISADAHMLVTLTPTGAPVGGATDYTWTSEHTYAELVASLDKVAFKTTEAGSENILVPTELYEALEDSQNVIFGMIPSNDPSVPKITNVELIVRPDGTAKATETTALISSATYTAGDNIEISSTNEISAKIPNVYGFDTVADMVGYTEFKTGDFSKVCGYLRKDDGVYNTYKIREKTGSEYPDGYELVEINDSLIAERLQYDGELVIELSATDNIQDYLDLEARKTIVLPKSSSIAAPIPLYVNSDTIIDLNGSILSGRRIVMYRLDDTFTEYNGNKNIVIKNGTLEGVEIWCMHNKCVSIENVAFDGYSRSGHVIQIAACYGFAVRNCEFNGTAPSNDHGSECINIDPCNYGGQPLMPQDSPMYDHTRNRNILIESNIFNVATRTGVRYTNAVGSHGRDDDGQTICEGLIIRDNDFGTPFYSAINMCDYIDVVIENNIASFDPTNMSGVSSFIVARYNQQKITINNNKSTGSVQFATFRADSLTTARSSISISNNTFETSDTVNEPSLYFYRGSGLYLSKNDSKISRCFIKVEGDADTTSSGQRANGIHIKQNIVRHPGTGGSNIIRIRYSDNVDVDANIFKFDSTLISNTCVSFVDDQSPVVSVTNNLANVGIDHFSDQIEFGGFRGNEALYTLASGFTISSLTASGDLNTPLTYYRTMVLMVGDSSNMRRVELKPWTSNVENFDTSNRTWRVPVLNGDNSTGYATLSITDNGTKYSYDGSVPIRGLFGKD